MGRIRLYRLLILFKAGVIMRNKVAIIFMLLLCMAGVALAGASGLSKNGQTEELWEHSEPVGELTAVSGVVYEDDNVTINWVSTEHTLYVDSDMYDRWVDDEVSYIAIGADNAYKGVIYIGNTEDMIVGAVSDGHYLLYTDSVCILSDVDVSGWVDIMDSGGLLKYKKSS